MNIISLEKIYDLNKTQIDCLFLFINLIFKIHLRCTYFGMYYLYSDCTDRQLFTGKHTALRCTCAECWTKHSILIFYFWILWACQKCIVTEAIFLISFKDHGQKRFFQHHHYAQKHNMTDITMHRSLLFCRPRGTGIFYWNSPKCLLISLFRYKLLAFSNSPQKVMGQFGIWTKDMQEDVSG